MKTVNQNDTIEELMLLIDTILDNENYIDSVHKIKLITTREMIIKLIKGY
jgi:hypothetical protein